MTSTDLPAQGEPAFDYHRYGKTPEQVAEIDARNAARLREHLMNLDTGLYTDSGMATLLGETMIHSLAWTPGRGWLKYAEGVWTAVTDVEAREAVRRNLDEFWRHTVTLPEFDTHDLPKVKALLRIMEAKKIDSIFKLMAGIMMVPDDQFDSHPFLLCVGNGVVDMSKKRKDTHHALLYEWSPSYFMTKKTTDRYRPNPLAGYEDEATVEAILLAQKDLAQALEAIPDPEEVIWLQSRLGQAATGLTPSDQRIVFPIGGGSNGKSVLFGAAVRALGTYAARVHESLLSSGENLGANMSLLGVRLAVLEELPQGHLLPDKVVKDLTDEGTMQGRYLYKNMVTFKPTHSLFVTTNYRPIVAEIDDSVWRRLKVLSFPLRYVPEGQDLTRPNDRHGDPSIKTRLWDGQFQREAVLAWIIEGAVRYGHRFTEYPERIESETQDWRDTSDNIGAFLRERTEFDPNAMVSTQELYTEFKWFMDARGHGKWTEATFAARLGAHPAISEHFVSKKRTRNIAAISRPGMANIELTADQVQVWAGLRWKTTAPSVPRTSTSGLTREFQDLVSH
jgi:putative DNA primase/helicase